jgi:hypothetical protein
MRKLLDNAPWLIGNAGSLNGKQAGEMRNT